MDGPAAIDDPWLFIWNGSGWFAHHPKEVIPTPGSPFKLFILDDLVKIPKRRHACGGRHPENRYLDFCLRRNTTVFRGLETRVYHRNWAKRHF